MSLQSSPDQPLRFNRVLGAMRRSNVLGVTVGGGVLGAMAAKYGLGQPFELMGAMTGLCLALLFVTKENLRSQPR